MTLIVTVIVMYFALYPHFTKKKDDPTFFTKIPRNYGKVRITLEPVVESMEKIFVIRELIRRIPLCSHRNEVPLIRKVTFLIRQ